MRLVDADKQLEWVDCMKPIHGIGLEPVVAVETVRDLIKGAPTIEAIPVEWLRKKAEENSHYAEPYFAFAYVLHEWQQTKSIEELQAESEMWDWQKEQEAQDG